MARRELGSGDYAVDVAIFLPMRADGMTGIFDIQVHSFRYAADFGGNHRFSLGISQRVIAADLTQRSMRRHNHMADSNDAPIIYNARRLGSYNKTFPSNTGPFPRKGPGEPNTR